MQPSLLACVYDGTLYLDENCNAVEAPLDPNDVCNAGFLQWNISPISLIWEDGTDIESNIAVVDFPLDPTKSGISHIWKASEKTPLLVFDPSHEGKITEASQLFGNWTFGGQAFASMGKGSKPTPWENGFDALATLDKNADGRVSGEELDSLGLWFDKNQDGISQEGEVKSLAEVQVTTLYYKTDWVDEKTKSIHASLGYERIIEDKTIKGASVDWYGAGGDSQHELIGKFISQPTLCESGSIDTKDIFSKNLSQKIAKTEATESREKVSDIAKSKASTLYGIWEWKADERDVKTKTAPQGIFIFGRDQKTERVKGHSITEMKFARKQGKATRMANFDVISGEITGESAGLTNFEFSVMSAEGTVVENTSRLSKDGKTLIGESLAMISYKGKPITLKYRWSAKKKPKK